MVRPMEGSPAVTPLPFETLLPSKSLVSVFFSPSSGVGKSSINTGWVALLKGLELEGRPRVYVVAEPALDVETLADGIRAAMQLRPVVPESPGWGLQRGTGLEL
jgi:hypothetical protein